jgi:hypothetical protein
MGEQPPIIWDGMLAPLTPPNTGTIFLSPIIGSGSSPRVLGSSFLSGGFGTYNVGDIEIENICIRVKSMTGTTHVAPTMTAFGLGYSQTFIGNNLRADTESPSTLSAQPAITVVGFETPFIQNAGNIYLTNCSANRYGTGFIINEHTGGSQLWANVAVHGFEFAAMNHACHLDKIFTNGAINSIYLSGNARISVDELGAERGIAGHWYDYVNADVASTSSNTSTGYINTFILASASGQQHFPSTDGNNTGLCVTDITNTRYFNGAGFSTGRILSASSFNENYPVHEVNSGQVGYYPLEMYTTNQNSTSGQILITQYNNTAIAGTGDKRVGQFSVSTDGAINTGFLNWTIMSAGTLQQMWELRPNRANLYGKLFVAGAGGATTTPTANIQLAAGASSANNSPFKFTTGGTQLATPENLVLEPATGDADLLFTTGAGSRYTLDKTLKATATLDFPSTTSTTVADLTITVTGAAVGDPVYVGIPNGSVTATASFIGWVSATNTVTVRFSPKATEDPASGSFKVVVSK